LALFFRRIDDSYLEFSRPVFSQGSLWRIAGERWRRRGLKRGFLMNGPGRAMMQVLIGLYGRRFDGEVGWAGRRK
jgi:hypothetical protein